VIEVFEAIADVRSHLEQARRDGKRVGLVPTMGALHDGHASLIRRAAESCDVVCTTIFVNPLQFGEPTDLDSYPRTLATDILLADENGATVVFAPTVEEMYGGGTSTTVSVSGALSDALEGASRPGHFDGVATVVTKLFAIAGPCRAYFGEKDFQQLAIVRRMTADLSLPVQVIGCPTVRDDDGLALSSRNVHLTNEERRAAPSLHRALAAGADCIRTGETDPDVVLAAMTAVTAAEPLVELDYAAVVDASSFTTPNPLCGELRLLVAARLGKTRLIDNLGVTVTDGAHRRGT
jgi:pantoate--beta-alanine ligase